MGSRLSDSRLNHLLMGLFPNWNVSTVMITIYHEMNGFLLYLGGLPNLTAELPKIPPLNIVFHVTAI